MTLEDFLAQLHVLADELGVKLWSAIERQGERARAQAIADAKERLRAELGNLEIDPTEPSMQSTADTTSQPHPRRRHTRAQLGARGFSIPRKASAAKLARLDTVVAGLDGDFGDDSPGIDADIMRPRTRGDCAGGPRPCPFMGCRHHLAVDVTDAGSLRISFPLDRVRDTCALDVAERGEHTLDQVGELLNLTRERVRQIEAAGLAKAVTGANRYGLADAGPFLPDRDQGAN